MSLRLDASLVMERALNPGLALRVVKACVTRKSAFILTSPYFDHCPLDNIQIDANRSI
jgi:hypothetical protein